MKKAAAKIKRASQTAALIVDYTQAGLLGRACGSAQLRKGRPNRMDRVLLLKEGAGKFRGELK
jgi:hypothetical protein